MDYNEVLETARTKIGTKCKACPICNGVACRNTMPGPGAKGIGDTAIRNYQKWQEINLSGPRIMLVADNELHRTNIERECLPAIAEAFNVTNIRVVTQG